MQAQGKPDFSGVWILDKQRSGPEKVIWNQTRSGRFVQSLLELTIDTGDGSIFGVPAPVTGSPLVYKLDGSPVIVIDQSLGDLADFVRKIRTEAKWDDTKLVTLTTHFSESAGSVGSSVTRVLTFSMLPGGSRNDGGTNRLSR
jgi:hypothetical protein